MNTVAAAASDAAQIGAALGASERGFWHPHWHIDKWDREEDRLAGLPPDDTSDFDGNILLTAGITRMLNLLTAAGGQGMDSAHCRLAAGDGSTAVTIADTDLSAAAGSAHRWFQLCTSVSVSTNVLTIVATFGTADGNFAWNEFGIDLGTASANTVTAPLFSRKVASNGTKASGASWTLTVTVTIS